MQKSSRIFKPSIHNITRTRTNIANIWLHLHILDCLKFVCYCGKMYSYHIFSYGGLHSHISYMLQNIYSKLFSRRRGDSQDWGWGLNNWDLPVFFTGKMGFGWQGVENTNKQTDMILGREEIKTGKLRSHSCRWICPRSKSLKVLKDQVKKERDKEPRKFIHVKKCKNGKSLFNKSQLLQIGIAWQAI